MPSKPRIRWHLTAAHTDGRLLRAELWIPAGTPGRLLHSHRREEERHELLAGEMELELGADRRTLGRGDGAVIPPEPRTAGAIRALSCCTSCSIWS